MSEGGDSKWGTAFFLGFLLGVFVCLGAGGTFVMFRFRMAQEQMLRAREAEMHARMEAEEARRAAEVRARAAELAGKAEAELLPPPKEKVKGDE